MIMLDINSILERGKVDHSLAEMIYKESKESRDLEKSCILGFTSAAIFVILGNIDKSISIIREGKAKAVKLREIGKNSSSELLNVIHRLKIFDIERVYRIYKNNNNEDKLISFYIDAVDITKKASDVKVLAISIDAMNKLLNEIERDERLYKKYSSQVMSDIKVLQDLYYKKIPSESRMKKKNIIGD